METSFHSIKLCTEAHLPEITEILNEAILNTTAIYDYKPRTLESMKNWFAEKQSGNYPVTGIFDHREMLLVFATYGPFRNRPAYKYSAEHSLYVRLDMRGKGLGKRLLREIIRAAEMQQYHALIGGIDASNKVSIMLHEHEGFVHCGTIRQAGYKFGRWLDLAFYQLLLKTPVDPQEE
jgi:L-amino acid N-acyltransferase